MVDPRSSQLSIPGLSGIERRSKANVGAKGREFHALLTKLLNDRERTFRYGWSHVNPEVIRHLMRPLWQWTLDHCGFVSDEAAAECYHTHQTSIRHIATGNAAGRAQLRMIAALFESN